MFCKIFKLCDEYYFVTNIHYTLSSSNFLDFSKELTMIFVKHHFFLDKSGSRTMYFHSSSTKGGEEGVILLASVQCFKMSQSKWLLPMYIHTLWVHPSTNLLKN
jgi:hypothetical protein